VRVVIPSALIRLALEVTTAQIPRICLLVIDAAMLMKILIAISIPLLEISICAMLDLMI
jgi:hypothetical protein